MNNYDVIIIGAGPGGIFGAYELIEKNPDCKIAVFEAGHELAKRKCPIDGKKIKSCISCKSCSIMSGFGGAGAFSDGKYNITNDFGGTLYEHIGKQPAIDLMEYVDEINIVSSQLEEAEASGWRRSAMTLISQPSQTVWISVCVLSFRPLFSHI